MWPYPWPWGSVLAAQRLKWSGWFLLVMPSATARGSLRGSLQNCSFLPHFIFAFSSTWTSKVMWFGLPSISIALEVSFFLTLCSNPTGNHQGEDIWGQGWLTHISVFLVQDSGSWVGSRFLGWGEHLRAGERLLIRIEVFFLQLWALLYFSVPPSKKNPVQTRILGCCLPGRNDCFNFSLTHNYYTLYEVIIQYIYTLNNGQVIIISISIMPNSSHIFFYGKHIRNHLF